MTNEQIIKDAIKTSTLSHGLLNAEQAKKFLQQTFDSPTLLKQVRHVLRTSKTGEIDKIGIARRILRGKTEDTDDGYRASVNTNVIDYSTTAVRAPWEITEETLRENIEGQNLEKVITDLMTKQIGLDEEDLCLNSNTAAGTATNFSASASYNAGDIVVNDGHLYQFTAAHATAAWSGTDVLEIGAASDTDFLKLNDGWIKQIAANGHVFDASTLNSGAMSLDIFYKALATIPNKYNNGNLRWIMSPHRAQEWELFLLNKVVGAGGAVPENLYTAPVRIPTIECSNISDDKILLVDPKNLIEVNSYNVQVRKTTEGKEAIMQDKRFYVVHFDFDPIIEETDATCIITGLA